MSISEEREINPDGTISCGVFIPLPYYLAKDFPDKKHEDDSVPHLTLLYAGNLSPATYLRFVRCIGRVSRNLRPFSLDLAAYNEFLNSKGQCIAHMKPGLSGCSKLAALHGILRRAVEADGIRLAHNYGPGSDRKIPYEVMFKSHATLAYMSPGRAYFGPKPTGSWRVTELECWGHERYRIQLGRNSYDQPQKGPLLRRTMLALRTEAETSLSPDERHPAPGAGPTVGVPSLASDPRYADWFDKVLAGKTKKRLKL